MLLLLLLLLLLIHSVPQLLLSVGWVCRTTSSDSQTGIQTHEHNENLFIDTVILQT